MKRQSKKIGFYKCLILAIVLASFSNGFTQDSTVNNNITPTNTTTPIAKSTKIDTTTSTPDSNKIKVGEDKLTSDINLLEGVDILGENTISSIYIFWDSFSADMYSEVKKSIDQKKFANDHFYMQNIDREEFEQERILLLFEDRKKSFHNLFGENLDDLIKEEEK